MKRLSQTICPLALALSMLSIPPMAADDARLPGDPLIFGPFTALSMDQSVVRDIKTEGDSVWIKLNPALKDRELYVMISNAEKASYRKWDNGSYKLISPANSGKPANGWSDWVQTRANYIEYYMDGKLFLHLKRLQPPEQ